MTTFTPDALREYLDNRRGATFINLFTNTAPRMNKTNNPYFGNVVHESGQNVTFGAKYENSVNRRWDGKTDELFIAEQLWFGMGERINAYMARHRNNGNEYLVYQLRTNPATGRVYAPLHDVYRLADTGEVIEKNRLLPFFPVKSPSKKQRVEELDITETFPRTVHIDNGMLGRFRLGVQTIDTDHDQFVVTV